MIRARQKDNNVVGRLCKESRQVLCEEEEVRKRRKEHFASLLQGKEYNTVNIGGMRVGKLLTHRTGLMNYRYEESTFKYVYGD